MFNVKGGLVDVRALFRPPLHRRVTLVDQGNQAGAEPAECESTGLV